MKYYKVSEGIVTEMKSYEDIIEASNAMGDDSILAYCWSAQEALQLAENYDNGLIDYDNMVIEDTDITICCVRSLD